MAETEHHIIENGGLMYAVFDNGEQLRIVVPYYSPQTNNEPAEHDMDPDLDAWGLNRPGYTKSEISIPYQRVWIPDNTSEILAEIANGIYVFIGKRIIFFRTTQPIELFLGFVGNAGTQWSIAVSKDFVFDFFDYQEIVAVSRRRLEKKQGFAITDAITEDQFWDLTLEISNMPYANVKQTKFHSAWDNENEPFDQDYLPVLLKKMKRIPERRKEYSNTILALGPKMPMNISREIASFRTGLRYNPLASATATETATETNIPMMKWSQTENNIGPLPNNFHGPLLNRTQRNKKKCTKGKCAVMGGRTRRRRRQT